MRHLASAFALLLFSGIHAQTPCNNGFAGDYPCENIDLLSFISIGEFGAGTTNDIWGWTDPEDGSEYALVGLNIGTAFVDVTDPANVVWIGTLPTHSGPSTWRDIKVYSDHAFIVSEASDHGMQVFDLTRLREDIVSPTTFDEDAHYNGFGNCHNIAIDEESGFAYGVGTNTFMGGLHILDINDPLNPTLVGSFDAGGYIHDSQVVVYHGPDQDHVGKQIAFNSNGPASFLDIVDVTDKNDPTRIINAGYPNEQYIHQGWLSEDHRFFFHNDELDEINFGTNTHTFVWDLADLDNPLFLGFYDSGRPNTDHNNYTHLNHLFQSHYKAGFRVVQLTDPANLDMEEVAYFDTHPEDDSNGTDGSWSNYPYFESGTMIVTNIETGLFVLRFSDGFELVNNIEEEKESLNSINLFPNPSGGRLNISLAIETSASRMEIIDVQGAVVLSQNWKNGQLNTSIDISHLSPGLYTVRLGMETKSLVIK